MPDSATHSPSPAQETVLESRNLWKTYGGEALQVHALAGVDLAVRKGDFLVIAGPSGSGKTTLLNMLGALDIPTSGSVYVEGVDLASLGRRALADMRRDRIGFVFQSYNLVPVLTASENAELTLLLQGVPEAERKRRVEATLELVGLPDKGHRFPRELSGGQQQRVAIARALAPNPALVLADEPTANLDSKTSTALVELMRDINREQGTTFVFSSHDHRVIDRAARLVKLVDGKVASDTRPGPTDNG